MKMVHNLYNVLFIICTLYYCVVQSNPEIVQKNNDKTIRSVIMENQQKDTKSAQSMKNVHEKDVSDPVSNAGKQLSTFVSLINMVILGEAVVQNLTTFGEIGVNLMLMQNMPFGEDWISSVYLNSTFMNETEELRKIMEYGFDESISVDVIDKMIRVMEEISSFDSLDLIVNASETILRVATIYKESAELNVQPIYGMKALAILSELMPFMKNLSNDSKPLNALIIGGKIISNYRQMNATETLKKNYRSCKNDIRSDECVSVPEVHRNLSFDKFSIDDIKTVNVLLDFYKNSYYHYHALRRLVERKLEIISLYEKLSEVQNLIGTLVSYGAHQVKLLKLMSSIDNLKAEKSKLKKFIEVSEVFRPVSEAVAKMQKLNRNISLKRNKKNNDHEKNVLHSFRGLPKGVNTLNELFEILNNSTPPQYEYHNSKIFRRVNIMKEFTTLRQKFISFSKAVKTVQKIVSIIKIIEAFFSQLPELTSLESVAKNMSHYYAKIQLLENIPDEINVLKDIEYRVSLMNVTHIEPIKFRSMYSDWSKTALLDVFSPLARLVESARKIDELIKTNGYADEKIFSEAIENSKELSWEIIVWFNEYRAPNEVFVQETKEKIINIVPFGSVMRNGKIPFNAILNSCNKTESDVEMMKNTPFNTSEYSQLVSSLKELKKLKSEIPEMPSRKEVDDLKLLLTELNSLKPLIVSSLIKNESPSPKLTILMKGTPYGSHILGRLSDELNEYLELTEGISSIQDFEKENVEGSIRELLVGVDAIQVVVARNNFSAYDLFNDSKMIDDRFRKMVKYLDVTEEKILRSGARPGIEAKVDSALAYDFLSKFQRSVSRSMNSFRHDIWWILTVLKHGVDCDKVTSSICENDEKAPSTPKDDNETEYFIITAAVFVLTCIVFIIAVSCNNVLMAEKVANPEPVTSTSMENIQIVQMPEEDERADGGKEYSTEYSTFSEV